MCMANPVIHPSVIPKLLLAYSSPCLDLPDHELTSNGGGSAGQYHLHIALHGQQFCGAPTMLVAHEL